MPGTKSQLPNPPSLLESPTHRFLVFAAPNDDNLPCYISEWQKFNIRHIVRACDPTYETELLHSQGITVHNMPFSDGGYPSDDLVIKWLTLLHNTYNEDKKETIGVHCVAGLGRAPVLVAIALIESGTNALEAIQYIREKRSGAINMKQYKYLVDYKKKSKKKGPCVIM